MKCRKCGGKATVNMRQHKLALCSQHFLEWVPEQTERFIKKYEMFSKNEKILVAVSGGKDSLLCGTFYGDSDIRLMAYISVWELTRGSAIRPNHSV